MGDWSDGLDSIGPAGSGVVVRQQAQATLVSNAVSATFSSPPAPGDLLMMIGGAAASNATRVSGAAARWTRATASFTADSVEVWYGVATGSGSDR